MKKRIFTLILTLFLLLPLVSVTAYADCGPKPSTYITVHTGGGERAVVTLLGSPEGYKPYTPVEPGEEPSEYRKLNAVEQEAWPVFRDYRDPDGYCFWGELWDGNVDWSYWPAEVFKIAVYYPDYDILWVSEDVYERYAFHSDWRLNLPAAGAGALSGETDMVLKKESDIPEEVFGLLWRILLTIVIELSIARLFGFRSKRQKKVLLRVNLVTQLGLNVLLWVWYYWSGPLEAMLRLALAESAVLAAEAVCYLRWLREGESRLRTLGYTLCANLLSVLVGFLLLA